MIQCTRIEPHVPFHQPEENPEVKEIPNPKPKTMAFQSKIKRQTMTWHYKNWVDRCVMIKWISESSGHGLYLVVFFVLTSIAPMDQIFRGSNENLLGKWFKNIYIYIYISGRQFPWGNFQDFVPSSREMISESCPFFLQTCFFRSIWGPPWLSGRTLFSQDVWIFPCSLNKRVNQSWVFPNLIFSVPWVSHSHQRPLSVSPHAHGRCSLAHHAGVTSWFPCKGKSKRDATPGSDMQKNRTGKLDKLDCPPFPAVVTNEDFVWDPVLRM